MLYIELLSPTEGADSAGVFYYRIKADPTPDAGYWKVYIDGVLKDTSYVGEEGTDWEAITSYYLLEGFWDDISFGESHTVETTWGTASTGVSTFYRVQSIPVLPTPEDGATNVDFSNFRFSWSQGSEIDTCNLYVGPSADSLTLLASGIGTPYYVSSSSALAGALGEWPTLDTVYWRVDSVYDGVVKTGSVWSFSTIARINGISLGAGGSVVLCSTTRGAYLSTDFGETWNLKLSTGSDFGTCSGTGAYIIVKRTPDGVLYRSANGGTSWATIDPADGETFSASAISMSEDGQYMVVVGVNSTTPLYSCYLSTDYGVNWTVTLPTTKAATWSQCDISDDGQIIGVGKTGALMVTFDGGASWKVQTPPASNEMWWGFGISGDGKVGVVVNKGTANEVFKNKGFYNEVTVSSTSLTAYARSFIASANASDAADALDLGTSDYVTFAGLTLTGMSGVVKTTAGVLSGSATLDDMTDGTNYERVAATELSSGIYKNATTTVKGIASFSGTNFSVTDGAVSLATGGGMAHNDLGSLQGGTTGEYYHFTSADYAKIANWDTAYGWGDHSAEGYFVKASDDLDDVTAGTTNVHLTTTLKTSYDGAASHKTTEDAINGLVSCNGTGTYSAKAIGTDVQAYSSLLAAIAGLTPTDSNIIVGDGSTWVAESGATARISLGVGTTNSPTFTNLFLTTSDAADYPVSYCSSTTANYTPFFRSQRSVEMTLDSYRDSTSGSFLVMRHARGTVASPAILQNNDEIAAFFPRAYDGVSAWRNAAGIFFVVTGTPIAGNAPPASIRFYTATGSTTTHSFRGCIDDAGYFGMGTTSPQESIHSTAKVRADTAFNLNGTDGVTQAAAAGTVCDVTALAGGIATTQTQITYIADGAHSLVGITSITTANGRITAMA